MTETLRRRAKAAHVFLRSSLASVTNRCPADIDIQRPTKGKPYVAGGAQFNLSHSGALAVCVLHPAVETGIDVEIATRDISEAGLPQNLVPAERVSPPGDRSAWLRLWVRKEAVIKALGQGLHAHLPAFDVGHAMDQCDHWRCLSPEKHPPLCLFATHLPSGDPVAVAVVTDQPPDTSPRIIAADSSALIAKGMLLCKE
ncbi:MAG: 4'-phosphopantetheinyl transferase superfamily protein [Albidovulum sp.]|uniref:4'-phosphopantetheinyl transferase family protein n=1 Tax=Albidovulum sp. TaxID=1872424 RepID=UPI003CAA361F